MPKILFEVFRNMVDSTRELVREPGLIELFVVISAEAADATTPAHELYASWYERAVDETAQRLAEGSSVATSSRTSTWVFVLAKSSPSAMGCNCSGCCPAEALTWWRVSGIMPVAWPARC